MTVSFIEVKGTMSFGTLKYNVDHDRCDGVAASEFSTENLILKIMVRPFNWMPRVSFELKQK